MRAAFYLYWRQLIEAPLSAGAVFSLSHSSSTPARPACACACIGTSSVIDLAERACARTAWRVVDIHSTKEHTA